MPHSKHNHYYHTLPNGLKIICEHRPYAAAEYFGIAVMAGSRDEAPDEYGIAHFVEHTIFKGTAKRKSWHISNRMEAIGGELNAYTTKEETYVYSSFPRGNLSRAAELIFDLIANSQFPEKQINLERDVVADEISSYLDSPAEAVYDDFEDMLFRDTGIGHNILGTKETLDTFTSEKCRNFLERFYVASNMVAFYSGATPFHRVISKIEPLFAQLPHGSISRIDSSPDSDRLFTHTRKLNLHQSHTVLGTIIPGIYEINHAASALFTNIIGGPGMNSLLNLGLRERRGLVYTVEASTTLYRDTGMWSIYFGCDRQDTEKCIAEINRIISSATEKDLSDKKLAQYKRQITGQMTVARDNREAAIMSMARATLYHGHALTPEESAEKIMAVTIDDLRSLSSHLLNLSELTFC